MRRPRTPRARGLVAPVLLASAAAALVGAALVLPGTSGGFTAVITNSANRGVTAARFTCKNTFDSTTLKQNAYFEYQLTGTGATETDVSTAGNTGTYQNGHPTEDETAAGTASTACPGDVSTSTGTGPYSYTPAGSSDSITTATPADGSPATFSLAVWFRTTAPGGYLIGFDNGQITDGGHYDRHVYLNSTGQLVFGAYRASDDFLQVVTSPASYIDGSWHQVVATMSPAAGMTLWVDGAQVASNPGYTVAEDNASGYWRVAGGRIYGWPGAPTSQYAFFSGAMRFAAAYRIVLSGEEIAAEYRNGKPTS